MTNKQAFISLDKCSLYQEDLKSIAALLPPYEQLQNEVVFISGATGLIGSCLVDVIMHLNRVSGLNCKIYTLSRSKKTVEERFYCYLNNKNFRFLQQDINNPPEDSSIGRVGFVLHLASNTHPVAYAQKPIETITTNIIGTKNMLDFAVKHKAKRFVFASSVEIYGENRGDAEMFNEDYCGHINCNTLRAGYPEAKRCGEALCQAYCKSKNLDVVILRFARSYGPTMLKSDTKAISQFIKNAISGEDIVLKSEGKQYYSYTYAADAVSGLLTVLLRGECGQAYNVADKNSNITLRDLAAIIADFAQTKVIFKLPNDVEKAGYSTATKALLDGSKLSALGWKARHSIESGLKRTIEIMRSRNA